MIAIVLGTRPEIIKLSPVIHECLKQGVDFEIVHSNQHYSKEMDSDFFDQLELPKPAVNLKVGSGTHAQQTAEIMIGVEKYCLEKAPKLVVVHGDTNTTLAAALAAKKVHISVAHVEAGLRSRDELMPEEINRIITDKISNLLFAPTTESVHNLISDGVSRDRVFKTGNTIVDVIHAYTQNSKRVVPLRAIDTRIQKGEYIMATVHRPSNVDSASQLKKVVSLLNRLAKKYDKSVIWPIHPRAQKNIERFSLTIPGTIYLVPPTDYFSMLTLINNAFLIATDSGGIQEEAYILKKPLITLRDSTERPETLTANFLVDLEYDLAEKAVESFVHNQVTWSDNLGSGKASQKIVACIRKFLGE